MALSGLKIEAKTGRRRVSKAITSEHLDWYYDLELPEKCTETAKDPKERALISLFAKNFVRVTEAIQIELDNIDYEKESLSIINLREQVRIKCPNCGEKLAKRYHFCPICGNKVIRALRENTEQRFLRIVPVHRDTLNLVQEYLGWRRSFSYRGPLLFPFSRQRVWQIVVKVGRRAGLRGLYPGSFRHLLAARWVNKGLDIRKLKFLLGYASTAAHPPSFNFEELKSEYQKLWET